MQRLPHIPLLTVAPLEQRTLGFSKLAHRVTKEPTWELVPLLRHTDRSAPALQDVLRRCCISPDEWSRWSPVVYAPTFACALDLVQRARANGQTPSWVALALASHKIRSPGDAQSGWYDLALPLTSLPSPRPPVLTLPLLVLTTHAVAYFSLASLLRPLTSHILGLPPHAHTHSSFHFNALLQAISLFDRSRVATDVAVDILKEMENRGLTLWPNTERVLIRDNFRSPQLLDYLRRRASPEQFETRERSEAWLRAYGSFGRVQPSAQYLHTIRKQCLENGVSPPYATALVDSDDGDARGTAHKANTHYLRAMRDDRQSAFRYFHHLLKLDLAKDRQSPSPPASRSDVSVKSNIDIYDWTTALYAGAHDRTLSAGALLDLFRATKEGTNAYKPTRATYTVVIQGLLWKNALEDAQKLWDEFVGEVVRARSKGNEENEMRIDRKALCVGIDVLVQSGRTGEALSLLDQAVKRDIEDIAVNASPAPHPSQTATYLKVHPIHVLFSALLRIRRPDAIFYIWTHLTSLYFVPYTNLMLRILLKAALQASKMDGESVKGAMRWYMADNRLFKKRSGPIAPGWTPHSTTEPQCEAPQGFSSPESTGDTNLAAKRTVLPRQALVARLHALLHSSAPPSVVGIWAHHRSTEVARSIFRGMIFGNWPALRRASGPFSGGVTHARAKGGESVLQELARVFGGRPDRFLPSRPMDAGVERPVQATVRPADRDEDDKGTREQLGPPLPTVVPSESTFASYIALLGLSSRADEIPEVLAWMRALGVVPKRTTLAVAVVFWMEVGLRGPVFEDGWRRGADEGTGARTEYGALRAWIREWVGETRAPGEEDIYAGIKRVREMRDGQFGKRGGHKVTRERKQGEEASAGDRVANWVSIHP